MINFILLVVLPRWSIDSTKPNTISAAPELE